MTDIVERLCELYKFAAQQKSRDWDEQDEIRDLFKYTFNVAYEAVEEIERLREALRRVRTAIFDAKPEVLTDTLWMHDRLGETVVDCIDHALNDYDWEVRDRAALGEKE